MKMLSLLGLLVSLSGCVSLESVSLTSIPSQRAQRVESSAEKFIFLGFNFDNDFVDGITKDLKSQCPNGTVSGILTKSQAVNYFLFIFWKRKIDVTGYCIPNRVSSMDLKSKDKRRPSDEEQKDESSSPLNNHAEAGT